MRTAIRLFTAICAVAIIAGCNKDNTYSILGTWRATSIVATYGGSTHSASDENSTLFFEMKSDGTMIEYGSETKTAEYSYDDKLGIMTYRYSGKTDYSTATITFTNKDEFDWYEKKVDKEMTMHLKRK
jgi:hypothetical protein